MRSCPADPKRKKSVVVQHGTIREHIVAGQVDVIPTQWRQFAQQIFRDGLTCQACIRPSAVLPICSRRRINASSSASRSEEHTSELQSLMRNSYAVFCLKK